MKNLLFKMTSLHLQKMGSRVRIAAIVVLSLSFTLPVLAQHYGQAKTKGSSLILNTWDNRGFIIEIDGKRHRADGTITLRNLAPGKKRVRIMRKNMSHSHRMNGRSGQGVLLYNGFIDVPRNSRVRAKLTRGKSVQIISVNRIGQSRPHGNRPSGSCGTSGYEPHHGHLENYGYDHYEEDFYYEDSYGFEPYTEEHHGAYGGICAMEGFEFDRVIERLEREPFSSHKKSLMRQVLRDNYITSNQLLRILLTFSFDNDRLEVAKLAYDKVIDKENTWEIYDAFSFSSTADNFGDFVSGCR